MSSSDQAQLLHRVDRFYERHSAKCVSIAALLVGVSSFGGSLLLFMLFNQFVIAVAGFLLIGVAVVYLAFYNIVPPTKQLQESKDLIVGALNDPARIKASEQKNVVLEDDAGKTRTLNQLEQHLWTSLIVPYFMQNTAHMRQRKNAKPGRRLTASEERQMKERQEQLVELEKSVKEEREALEKERSELSARNESLKAAENLMLERLNSVEKSQAELEQLREDLASRAVASEDQLSSEEAAALKAKECELKDKESALEELYSQLSRDKEAVALQKAELSEMQKLSGQGQGEGRAERLAHRAKELEALAQDLERRSRYVSEVEDSLVSRLNQLSEREASIEQGEVECGLRKD